MRGKAWKFGHDINTDEIIPARYLDLTDPKELAPYCMQGAGPHFAAQVKPGDVIVAGRNFGCGSSREHAPMAITGCGVACVVAESFARIFYRNCVNMGLPIVETKAAEEIQNGDDVEVDLDKGLLVNHTRAKTYRFDPFAGVVADIVAAGGLMPYVKSGRWKHHP